MKDITEDHLENIFLELYRIILPIVFVMMVCMLKTEKDNKNGMCLFFIFHLADCFYQIQ